MLILSGEKNLIKIQLQTIIILHSQRQRGTSRVKEKKYRARKEHNRSPLEFIYMHKLIVS